MDDISDQLDDIKELIINGDSANYLYLGLILFFSLLGAFIGTYLKKKAENAATKSDIENITLKVEGVKSDVVKELERWKTREELINTYRGYQNYVLEEIVGVVVRISEIFEGKFSTHYKADIDFKNVQLDYLRSNKKLTTIYRFFRLIGAIEKYNIQSSSLPSHNIHRNFKWYIDRKINPVLSSGGYPGLSIIWRDGIKELGENMIEYSDKWKNFKPVSIINFLSLFKKNNEEAKQFVDYSNQFATFFSKPSIRLALLGIYLIDLKQDVTDTEKFEKIRNLLLHYVHKNCNGKVTIYGFTADGIADSEIIDLDKKVIPRNIRSKFYDSNKNICNYKIENIAIKMENYYSINEDDT